MTIQNYLLNKLNIKVSDTTIRLDKKIKELRSLERLGKIETKKYIETKNKINNYLNNITQ